MRLQSIQHVETGRKDKPLGLVIIGVGNLPVERPVRPDNAHAIAQSTGVLDSKILASVNIFQAIVRAFPNEFPLENVVRVEISIPLQYEEGRC